MANKKFTIKKFIGNGRHSWAIFHSEEVRGLRSPIMYGEARPVFAELSHQWARRVKRRLEERYA